MQDKEYPIKMFTSNITPFYLLRENFMNNYSYFISNVNSFPTVKNFSNFKGMNLMKEKISFQSFLKKQRQHFEK